MARFAQLGNDLYAGRRSFAIVRKQRVWYLISGALLLISLVALLTRGLNLGLEFKGGSEFQVTGAKSTSTITGQDAVKSVVAGSQPDVTNVGTNTIRVQTEKLENADTQQVQAALAKAYGVPTGSVTATFVGPSWGKTISTKALQGLIAFLVLVAVVITVYFRNWKVAVAAVIALLHDLVITVGIYALVGFEVTPASVIGFLTILGYSLYDTVVVFDKVRENTAHLTGQTKRTYSDAANLALNQTLVRSVNTSVVALLPIASILVIGAFLLGAGTLEDLALALFVGIATGTYSSIFIATPLLADLREREPELRALARRVESRRTDGPAPQQAPRPARGQRGAATAVLDRPDVATDADDEATPGEPTGRAADGRAGRPVSRPRATGPRNQPRRKPRRR